MLHYVFVSSVSYVYDILQCCIAFYAALSPHYALHHVCLPLSRSVLCPPFTGKQKACNVHSTSWVGLIGAILRSKVKITEAEEGWPHISRPLETHLLVYFLSYRLSTGIGLVVRHVASRPDGGLSTYCATELFRRASFFIFHVFYRQLNATLVCIWSDIKSAEMYLSIFVFGYIYLSDGRRWQRLAWNFARW